MNRFKIQERAFLWKRTRETVATGTFDLLIVTDKETGVNYLFIDGGSSSGLTVLVDEEGKPIISK